MWGWGVGAWNRRWHDDALHAVQQLPKPMSTMRSIRARSPLIRTLKTSAIASDTKVYKQHPTHVGFANVKQPWLICSVCACESNPAHGDLGKNPQKARWPFSSMSLPNGCSWTLAGDQPDKNHQINSHRISASNLSFCISQALVRKP